jgi:hypothetical protein
VYSNFVELIANANNTFTVGNVITNGRYTLSDAASSGSEDSTQVFGDVKSEPLKIIQTDGTEYRTDQTYWGKLGNEGVVVEYPSTKRPGGFSYILYTDKSYTQSDIIPRSTFDQSAFVLCFASGTRILTTRGEVAVEDLQVGDCAVTASGDRRAVIWTGHRRLGAEPVLPVDQAPIRIRAGAFGHGLPTRDLFLSPGHPVLVGADAEARGGVLVPVMHLVNGTTIARTSTASVTYWHVELDTHDILLAEGLAAESFLDFGCRPFFEEASDHELHNPDFVPPGLSARCRPVACDGPLVETERARLGAVFAQTLVDDCAWSGYADRLVLAAV